MNLGAIGGASGAQAAVNADAQSTFAMALQAIQAAGGTVQYQSPPTARFQMSKRDFGTTGGVRMQLDGELTVSPMGPRQSSVRVDLKVQSASWVKLIGINLVGTVLAAMFMPVYGSMILLVGLVLSAGQLWMISNKIPRELSDKVMASIQTMAPMQAAQGYGPPPQYAQPPQYAPPPPQYAPPPQYTAPAPPPIVTPPPNPNPPQAQGSVVEQLKQLAELRQVGAITPDEFEAKKAELLKRL